MSAPGLRFLLALFSAVLAAASSEGCVADSAGLCGALPGGEPSSVADSEEAQLDEEDALEANFMLLQTNLQHPRHQRVEALAQALASQAVNKTSDESQLSIVVGADAEAVRSGNASAPSLVEQQANASLSAASGAAPSVAVAVAASAATEPAAPSLQANHSQAAAARTETPSAAAAAAEAPAERPQVVAAVAAASAPKPAQAKAAAAPPPAAAVGVAEPSDSLALKERQSESAASAWPFGDIWSSVRDFGTGAAEKALDSAATGVAEAAAAEFASVVNSTLIMLDEKADDMVAYCGTYKDAILLNVSQSGDRKIEHFQGMVVTHIGQVQERWGLIVDTLAQSGPHLVRAISGLGLKALSGEAQTGVDRTLEIANHVTNAIANASQITTRMGGRTKKDLQYIMQELNATISAGLQATSAFADETTRLVQRVISGAAARLGISLLSAVEEPVSMLSSPDGMKSTFQALMQQAEDTITKVSTGMSDYLSGTLEAAEIVLAPVGGGGARGAQAMSFLVMAMVLLGTVVH